jgi:hypothetical protein
MGAFIFSVGLIDLVEEAPSIGSFLDITAFQNF